MGGPKTKVAQNVLKHILDLEFSKSDKISKIANFFKCLQPVNQPTDCTDRHYYGDQLSCSALETVRLLMLTSLTNLLIYKIRQLSFT